MFFLYFSQPQKILNKVTFSQSKGAVGHNKERTNQLKGLLWLIPRLLLVFLHSNYANQCTPRCTMDKGCGHLAASIGSTMKSYTNTTLIVYNSSKGSIFLECFRQASRVSHGWEAVNNHMRSCKSLDKPVRQTRQPTEGLK